MSKQATTTISPQAGRQTQFLSTPADIAIYGGAAGGGKTFALLLEPLRHIHNPRFGCVIFRRTYPQITMEGGMWDESQNLYPALSAVPNQAGMQWQFPSGATVSFAHMQYESDRQKFDGSQIALIQFDQLEHFSSSMFWYMLSRNRSTCGVRPYIRASCNPDPDSFLRGLLDWWIGDDGFPLVERAGALRWFVRDHEALVWADAPEPLRAQYELEPKSLTFIPASVYDNLILLKADPSYLSNLQGLLPVERARLLGDAQRGGNWNVRAAAGKIFNRSWFEIVNAIPSGGIECRFWDFAATQKMKGDDPDYTAGIKVRRVGGIYYVTDCIAVQEGPSQVDALFINTSRQDAQLARAVGTRYMARWEIEAGGAAIREARRLTQMLDGIDAVGVPTRGQNKHTRARPLAAQAQAGNVKLLAGAWNERFLAHMHAQPDAAHDDIYDAAGGAHNQLASSSERAQAKSFQG